MLFTEHKQLYSSVRTVLILHALGLKRSSSPYGHSPQAGGGTFYASLGLSEDIIQALGRWSSEAWKIYIHNNPTIHAELQLWLYGFASTICDCFAVISLSSLYSASIPHTQHQQLIIAGSCTCPSPIKMGAHGSGLWISTTQH